ncbi:hypothetical protein FAI40_06910 [Acetobacteraceae bacterium]|nr:hypothetical protein FAI40_06910 [Acetobacteraceae bacterium]
MAGAFLGLLFHPVFLCFMGILFLIAAYTSEFLGMARGRKILTIHLNLAGFGWLSSSFIGGFFWFISDTTGELVLHYFQQVQTMLPLFADSSLDLARMNALLPYLTAGIKDGISQSLVLLGAVLSGIPLVLALVCTISATVFGIAIFIATLISKIRNKPAL